jgi:hypothetical protein
LEVIRKQMEIISSILENRLLVTAKGKKYMTCF